MLNALKIGIEVLILTSLELVATIISGYKIGDNNYFNLHTHFLQ